MIGIFYDDGDGVPRMTGYARDGYQTTDKNETLKETTEDDLASVFKTAKSNGGTLDGADSSIDAAIDDPLAFLDFLVLVDGSIEFDSDYVRETPDETQAALEALADDGNIERECGTEVESVCYPTDMAEVTARERVVLFPDRGEVVVEHPDQFTRKQRAHFARLQDTNRSGGYVYELRE